jgi:ribosomal-protein-alanine N-acetyltransferase
VTLLRVSIAHAAALAAIHAAAFPPGEAWDAAAFRGQLQLAGVFGAIDPAGGMVLARIAADAAEILTLAVMPESRRQGLGAELLRAALAEAAARGASAMFLEVSEANAAARALYAGVVHAGERFAAVGRRRRYYRDGSDALLLRCALIPPCGSADG